MFIHYNKPAKSSSSSIDYNEDKIFRGEAEIIAVRNIKEDTMFMIRMTMEELESNPLIRANVKKKGLHFDVNPSDDDNEDEKMVVNYIDDFMTLQGYENQPYVIIKHFDIDRVHYHVISTRVDINGRLISDSFFMLKGKRFERELSRKYGYTNGMATKEATQQNPAPLKKEMKNKIKQIKANVLAAAMSTHNGEIQLKAVLRFYGILLERGVSINGHPYESFHAIDDQGKSIGFPIPVKKVLDEPFDKFYRKHHLELCFTPKREAIFKLKRVFEQNKIKKGDIEEFRKLLNKSGFSLYLCNNKGMEAKDMNEIEDAVFFEQKTRVCLSLDDCSLRINDIRRMIGEHESKKQELDLRQSKTSIKIHR
jgi:hypothetical protein